MTDALRTMVADFVLAPNFAAELRRNRQAVGLSQAELASALACNPSVISDYEQGRPRKAKVRVPVTQEAKDGVELARVTLNLVQSMEAKAAEQGRAFWWWMENPTGMLRYVDFMVDLPRQQVNYCRYGLEVQKPTDLWGRHPAAWSARRPLCKAGDSCHKPAAEGVVAMANAAVRAEVPYQLSLDVCLAVEATMGSRTTTAPAVQIAAEVA